MNYCVLCDKIHKERLHMATKRTTPFIDLGESLKKASVLFHHLNSEMRKLEKALKEHEKTKPVPPKKPEKPQSKKELVELPCEPQKESPEYQNIKNQTLARLSPEEVFSHYKTILVTASFTLVIFIVLLIVFSSITWLFVVSLLLVIISLVPFAYCIYGFFYSKKYHESYLVIETNKKRAEEHEREIKRITLLNEQINDANRKIEVYTERYETYLLPEYKEKQAEYRKECSKWERERKKLFAPCHETLKELETVLGFLPKKYRKADAVFYFYELFKNGRASTLKEMMNIYEQERIERERIDAINNQTDAIIRETIRRAEEHQELMESQEELKSIQLASKKCATCRLRDKCTRDPRRCSY